MGACTGRNDIGAWAEDGEQVCIAGAQSGRQGVTKNKELDHRELCRTSYRASTLSGRQCGFVDRV